MAEQATIAVADDVPVNLARRLIQRHHLRPKVDVLGLALRFANVVIVPFPFPGDGICLDPKPSGAGISPRILINPGCGRERRRFTLAHELGHVLIPHHFGTVLDDFDHRASLPDDLWMMEVEANRFASELLLPSDWLVHRCRGFDGDAAALCGSVAAEADVSMVVAALRIIRELPPGFGFASHRGGRVTFAGRSPGTLHDDSPAEGTPIEAAFPSATMRWEGGGADTSLPMLWVRFPALSRALPDLGPERDWRGLLDAILEDVEPSPAMRRSRWTSICARVAAGSGRSGSREETYEYLIQGFRRAARHDAFWSRLIAHPRWTAFLGLRIRLLRPF